MGKKERCSFIGPAHFRTSSEPLGTSQVLALIMAGTSLTGLCSVLLGKLGVGKAAELAESMSGRDPLVHEHKKWAPTNAALQRFAARSCSAFPVP